MKKIFTIIIISCLFVSVCKSQDEKFKALYLYNITKFIEWPTQAGPFIIKVLGESPVSTIYKAEFGQRTVNAQSVEIISSGSVAELNNAQIIYIPASHSASIPAVIAKVAGRPVLVITDLPGSTSKGASISFVSNGKLNIQISRRNIESHGLKVNTQLIELGIDVD